MNSTKFIVGDMYVNNRIDKFLAERNEDVSRSRLKKLLDDGIITVNGEKVKANYRLRENDFIKVVVPDVVEPDIPPKDIPLDVVFEDEDIIVINKPKGMVVHPSAGHFDDTMVNALLYHCKGNLSRINGELKPGIVHRIDMDTTGVIVACKNDVAHNFIAEQFKEHTITRKYQAIVYNSFSIEGGTIEGKIGRHPIDRKKMAIVNKNGKDAITHYKVLENFKKFAHVECQLETGRTHQIRVHMASINHPLLGDFVYGPKTCPYNLQGQTLHAGTLGFIHPRTKEYVEFSVPLPDYFKKLIDNLSNK